MIQVRDAINEIASLTVLRFSGKLQEIDYALLPNHEWNQKTKT